MGMLRHALHGVTESARLDVIDAWPRKLAVVLHVEKGYPTRAPAHSNSALKTKPRIALLSRRILGTAVETAVLNSSSIAVDTVTRLLQRCAIPQPLLLS